MCIKNAKSTWSILMSPLAYIETFLWTEVKHISPDLWWYADLTEMQGGIEEIKAC